MQARTPDKLPISTLIVDDEDLARGLIRSFIRRDRELTMVGECADGAAALDMIESTKPDLVFLDVQMPVLDGVAVAEQVQQFDTAPYVIFTTAFNHYAIRAFEVNALDYLVKPISKPRFVEAVQRAKRAIRSQEIVRLSKRLIALNAQLSADGPGRLAGQWLTVRKGDVVRQLTTDDIVWLEAANQYVHLHTENDRYTVSESLGNYANRIKDPRFVRVHRSAVVNGTRVRSISRRRNGTHVLHLDNGDELVLARARSALLPRLLRLARENTLGSAQP